LDHPKGLEVAKDAATRGFDGQPALEMARREKEDNRVRRDEVVGQPPWEPEECAKACAAIRQGSQVVVVLLGTVLEAKIVLKRLPEMEAGGRSRWEGHESRA